MPHLIRAGRNANQLTLFLEEGCIAIGWDQVGDIASLKTRWKVKAKLQQAYPEDSTGSIANSAGQLLRFKEIETGDVVVTFDPDDREYHIGIVTSGYSYLSNASSFRHRHSVEWVAKTSRDDLRANSRNSLGSISTIFSVSSDTLNDLVNHASFPKEMDRARVEKVLKSEQKAERSTSAEGRDKIDQNEMRPVEATVEDFREEVVGQALEFIKDRITQLEWNEMEDLMAGILRGMGYKTLMSERGADRGRDILASPDGLGLETPRIIVEVKHRIGKMGAPNIRNLLGGLREGDKGLYLSTGGFTQEARYEADRASTPVTLIDLDRLANLLTQYYDELDSDVKALVPLRKIWWPV